MDAGNTIQVPLPMRFPGRKYSGTESLLNTMEQRKALRRREGFAVRTQRRSMAVWVRVPAAKKDFFWIFYKIKN